MYTAQTTEAPDWYTYHLHQSDGVYASRVTNAIRDAVRPDITMFVECRNDIMDEKPIVRVIVQRLSRIRDNTGKQCNFLLNACW